jgi:hypothetical protein
MATFGANINTIAEKLTDINVSLQTIAGAIQGGKITIDLTGVEQALRDLQFNGMLFKVGNRSIYFDGKLIGLGED